MRLPKICGLLTASALLIGANSANALILTIDDLGDSAMATVVDDTTDLVPNNGNVFFNGTVGVFEMTVSNGFGFPSISRTGPQFAATDLSLQTEGTLSGVLEVTLLDEGRSIITGASGSTEAFSNLDFGQVTNANVTTTTSIKLAGAADFTPLSTRTAAQGDLDEAIRLAIVSGSTFDLKTVIRVEHIIPGINEPGPKFAFTNADGNFRVSAVPLPAALPLFLTALVGLGFVGRQRRRQAA